MTPPLQALGVLVLAAGKSTRITPLANGQPKPLLRIVGRSLLEWNLLWLADHGVATVWVNLHYRPEAITGALGDGERLGVRVRYSPEPELLGTAGAWRRLEKEWTGTSLVIYGDNLMRFDLRAFLAAHRAREALATIALFDVARHSHTGSGGGHVRLDARGRVSEFVERRVEAGPDSEAPGSTARYAGMQTAPAPPGRGTEATSPAGTGATTEERREFINAGAYLLEPAALDWIPPGFQDFGCDVFPRAVSSGFVYGHVIEEGGFCLGLDTPERFAAAERRVAAGEVALA